MEEGMEEGMEMGMEKIISNMLKNKMSITEIAEITGLTIAKIEQIITK